MKLGLHQTARYYYYPGWHELSNVNEFTFNKKAYEALPVDLRRVLDHAVSAVHVYGRSGVPRQKMRSHSSGYERSSRARSRSFSFRLHSCAISRSWRPRSSSKNPEKTPMARKVHASYTKFQALVGPWDHVAEGAYHQFVAG